MFPTNLNPTGALELNKAKKIYLAKEKALAEGKIEVTCMTVSNRELRASMVMSLIERDELEAKKKALQQKLQKMKEDIDGLDNQSDFVLRSVEASCQPQQRNKS